MQSILTLSIGQFELVHDVLSLSIIAMGAAALFFLLSRKQVRERFQPLVLLAGVVAMIGCYHAIRLFDSWNEAFELAGNSYAASGHFFHESYRYSDWVLTMPLLLVELVLVLGLPQEKTAFFLKRLIGAALITILFAYLGERGLGEHHGLVMRWGCWILETIFFFYLGRLLCVDFARAAASESPLVVKAGHLFLLSWAFYPFATLIALFGDGFGANGIIVFLVGASIADFLSKCVVSFYLYRAAQAAQQA